MSNQETNALDEQKASNYRWTICFLLLAAMAINYVHRQTLGLLKNDLQHVFHWDENGYANVVFFADYRLPNPGHGLPRREPYATLLTQLKVSGDKSGLNSQCKKIFWLSSGAHLGQKVPRSSALTSAAHR